MHCLSKILFLPVHNLSKWVYSFYNYCTPAYHSKIFYFIVYLFYTYSSIYYSYIWTSALQLVALLTVIIVHMMNNYNYYYNNNRTWLGEFRSLTKTCMFQPRPFTWLVSPKNWGGGPPPSLDAPWHHPSPCHPLLTHHPPPSGLGGYAEAVTSPGCLSVPSCCITTAVSSSSSSGDRGDRISTANSLIKQLYWRYGTQQHPNTGVTDRNWLQCDNPAPAVGIWPGRNRFCSWSLSTNWNSEVRGEGPAWTGGGELPLPAGLGRRRGDRPVLR